ncbi:DeoR/GlpR family DNA-binding transcription regulator (plasmid) [Agrobacterium leguminum]|uniref:DeoR/GlpR family DNA-binding transcription regulator n=1 Tax=Agrobacterium leguminum TaxID=2792015 RepID=UPI00272D5B90|nr:DeoR/GlpR family DNA-binding transcription regulator [Agrobacterium leguminum]WLE00763.1 DeoR/GlpR family DNA-binding transcription regulator [Agrobacterium leguminum]
MIPAERQRLIVEQLIERGVLSIAELCELLGVSHMTVRRDIQLLERQGRLTSVAGGVTVPERLAFEPSHIAKSQMALGQKISIGALAASMVPRGAVLYLDAGTTTLEIARKLAVRDDLVIVTNDFVVASLLMQQSSCKLFHTGGAIDRENQSSAGELAAEAIRRFNFDIAFMSTSSFGLRGVSTPADGKVVVKRAIVESSAQVILATDSSKYGRVGAFNAVPLDVLSAIISDDGLPEAARAAMTELGISVHIAAMDPAAAA